MSKTEELKTILLTNDKYIHIINENSGKIRLVEGPIRVQLQSHENIHLEIHKKITLRSNEYCTLLNPINEGVLNAGKREVKKGPQIFSLHPGESMENKRKSISVARNEGVYIRNIQTGVVRIDLGPKEIFLGAYEELYEKELTERESTALKLDEDRKYYKVISVELQKDEVIQLYDRESTRNILGPKRVFLKPFERPRVLKISGNTPKQPGIVIKSKLSLGPSFISDILQVRTKDNALLNLFIRYKQRFIIDLDNLGKIYLINDFVGFATESLASEIREEAAKHNFEDFHANTYDIIKDLLFPKNNEGVRQWRQFENGLEIFSVDIKSITPEDPDIIAKLNLAIQSNMEIYIAKLLQRAELEARTLLIKGKKELEELRKDLIELKNSNLREERIGKAKIDAKAEIVKISGKTEAEILRMEVQRKAEVSRVDKMKHVLQSDGADKYLRLVELKSIKRVPKSYIMRTDSKINIPYTNKKTE